MLRELVVQGIGAIGYSILGLSYFKEKKSLILFMQIISYIFFVIHYYLLSGITGAICNLIGMFALISIYLFEKYNLKHKVFVSVFFIILILVINIMTFQNIYSIFPMIASTIVIISFLKNDENIIRIVGIIVCICWLLYAIVYKSYVAILFQIIMLIDIFISLIKNMRLNKKS